MFSRILEDKKKREKEKRTKSFGMKFGWNFFKEFLIFI